MPDLDAGSVVAGCRIEAVAGRGGMGVVYRATQLALGRPVALKAIAAEFAQDTDYRERFERESRIAAAIDHPNVIPVYEAGEFDGTLYLIMRWVDGIDLRTLLRTSGPVPPARAIRLLRPVAAALSAAHRAGLVHRDVKPANVLIARGETEEEEHVYLTDFGIARRTAGETAMTRTGMFVGTIDYTAPERIEGGKGDATSDVYSFGCMLFETLTGHIPYDRPSEVAKVFAHVNDPVPSARTEAENVPEALDAIIAKGMAKNPAERFASASEVVSALSGLLHEMETEGRGRPAAAPAPQTAAPAAETAAPTPQTAAPAAQTAATGPTAAIAAAATASAAPSQAPARPERPVDDEVRVQRVRRRGLVPLLIAGLVAAALVVVVVALSGGGSSAPSTKGAGPSSAPKLSLGGQPAALSVGPTGNLWASLPGAGEVARVGAATERARRFAVGGHPGAIAAARDGLWVAGSAAGPLARFNLRTGRPELTAHLATTPSLITVDPEDGTVWAVDAHGATTHLSASGDPLGSTATLSPVPVGVAAGEGHWLWAAAGSLVRVGSTGGPATYSAGPDPVAVTLDQGVWTAHANGHVTRFDPRPDHLSVNTDVPVAPSLDAISAVEGGSNVWAISKQTKTVYRISTATGAPITGRFAFSSPPVALAASDGGVWVATADGSVAQIGG